MGDINSSNCFLSLHNLTNNFAYDITVCVITFDTKFVFCSVWFVCACLLKYEQTT